jgi:type IV secretion system protein VirB9
LIYAVLVAGSLFGVPVAYAEMTATPLPGDSRLVQFEYDPDQTYLILSRPKAVTHVEFAADEKIMTVAGGDTKNWELTPTSNRKHLFIKPIYDGIESSMTIITDKRSYQFVLRSTGPGAKWYQRVTWRHGQTVLLDLANPVIDVGKTNGKEDAEPIDQRQPPGVNPKSMSFGYQITGDADFKPVSIFDDGKFTWIKLPPGLQEMPALFAMADGDEFQLVNSIVDGEFLVAQRVIQAGVLKLGRAEVRFARIGGSQSKSSSREFMRN